ncbi:RdgB/HAM1 family non-canonical purine NTP pyrophosphatase [Sphingobacterium hungaricum]
MKILFATNNLHKLEEVQAIIGNQFDIQTLEEVGLYEDIPETGDTFEANAKQKSDYLVDKLNMDCFADDSGLEIDALHGEPGVYSARYSGSRDMGKNIELVLQKMEGITDRSARFRTVISLQLNAQNYFFEGAIEGTIINSKVGTKGFGYDPIFIPNGYDKTFAEMSADEKNSISHRAIAVKKLAEFLSETKKS